MRASSGQPLSAPTVDLGAATQFDTSQHRPDLVTGAAAGSTAASVPSVSIAPRPNPNYRMPGSPTADEIDGNNPFMALGASKEMRDAFRRRASRLRRVANATKSYKTRAANINTAVGATAEATAALRDDEDDEDGKDGKERRRAGKFPAWISGRATLPSEFELFGQAEDEAGPTLRPYDVLPLSYGTDLESGAGVKQVGCLKLVVRVLSAPPPDALGHPPQSSRGRSEIAWGARGGYAESFALESESDASDSDGEGVLGSGSVGAQGIDNHVASWWRALVSEARHRPGAGGGGGGGGVGQSSAAAREADRKALAWAWLNAPAFVCRVYCLEGRDLTAKDNDGRSDPFVRCKVGKPCAQNKLKSRCERKSVSGCCLQYALAAV